MKSIYVAKSDYDADDWYVQNKVHLQQVQKQQITLSDSDA